MIDDEAGIQVASVKIASMTITYTRGTVMNFQLKLTVAECEEQDISTVQVYLTSIHWLWNFSCFYFDVSQIPYHSLSPFQSFFCLCVDGF